MSSFPNVICFSGNDSELIAFRPCSKYKQEVSAQANPAINAICLNFIPDFFQLKHFYPQQVHIQKSNFRTFAEIQRPNHETDLNSGGLSFRKLLILSERNRATPFITQFFIFNI